MPQFIRNHPLLLVIVVLVLWSYMCFGPTLSQSTPAPTPQGTELDQRIRRLERDNCMLRKQAEGRTHSAAVVLCP